MSEASPSRKSAYHHGSIRESSIAVGLEILKTTGLEKFSLREVARRLGVTPTALYHHFPDKQDLLAALSLLGLQTFQTNLEAAAQSADNPMDGLMAMGRAYMAFFQDHPHFLGLVFHPAFSNYAEVLEGRKRTFEFLQTMLLRIGFSPSRAEYIGIWIWSSVHGLAHMFHSGILCHPAKALAPDPPDWIVDSPEQLITKVFSEMRTILEKAPNL